jgi:nitrite reductase/ring-hydroxylating ferredoxin subunit
VAGGERLICASAALPEAGRAVRFAVEYFGEAAPAFVIRFGGAVYAYLNRCGHQPMELDWREGEFFDADGRNLICSTHGAIYAPADGRCVGGPCGGTPLVRLRVAERGGNVYYLGQDDG